MFRDLKEYQNLQKLYEEKVSKVENINEQNVRGDNVKPGINVGNMFKKIGDSLRPKPNVGSRSRFNITDKTDKTDKLPTTDEIRAKSTTGMSNIPKGEGTAVINGKKLNPNFGKEVKIDTSKGPDEIEPENQSGEFGSSGQPSASVQIKRSRLSGKTGKERAQELAKMRIGSGTAKNPDTKIEDLKKANTKSMKERAKARFEKFKADREAKRLEKMKEEYTPYDMVLEYLLSTEQAATIEEANYVMMQLDEENIQEIVGQVAKAIMKTPLVKLVPAAIGTGIATKMIASKMGQKSGENEIKKSTTPNMPTKKSDPIKDLIPNIKKRNKALEDAINQS